MNDCCATTVESARKSLIVLTVNLHSRDEMNNVGAIVHPLFAEVAPFLTHQKQVLYARDMPQFCLDGIYPGGTSSKEEISLAVPAWPADIMQLTDALAREIHRLARFQTAGYPMTLGETIASHGLALYFAHLRSRWQAPWFQACLSDKLMDTIQAEWDTQDYNHDEWFSKGKYGRWAGYSVGYFLAQKVFRNELDLPASLQISSDVLKKAIN